MYVNVFNFSTHTFSFHGNILSFCELFEYVLLFMEATVLNITYFLLSTP